jgi:hypothetical protein
MVSSIWLYRVDEAPRTAPLERLADALLEREGGPKRRVAVARTMLVRGSLEPQAPAQAAGTRFVATMRDEPTIAVAGQAHDGAPKYPAHNGSDGRPMPVWRIDGLRCMATSDFPGFER